MIWIYLACLLVAHEGAHALALKAYGIDFSPRVWYSRHFPYLGFGWKYFVDGVDLRRRHTVLMVGPLVEAILWCLGAIIFPEYSLEMVAMAAATLLMNRFIPGGDIWKAHRLTREMRTEVQGAH